MSGVCRAANLSRHRTTAVVAGLRNIFRFLDKSSVTKLTNGALAYTVIYTVDLHGWQSRTVTFMTSPPPLGSFYVDKDILVKECHR